MATRQRSRSPRKTASSSSSTSTRSTETEPTASETRTKESALLQAAFDPAPLTDSTPGEAEAAKSDAADTPKATFVGEQLIYKERYERIAEAAYLRAERRGFVPGYEVDDWLTAEREIDALLSSDGTREDK